MSSFNDNEMDMLHHENHHLRKENDRLRQMIQKTIKYQHHDAVSLQQSLDDLDKEMHDE